MGFRVALNNFLPPEIRAMTGRLRNGFRYPKSLASQVIRARRDRKQDVPLRDDLRLLKSLHAIFPSQSSTVSYSYETLTRNASARYLDLQRKGLSFKGIKVLDLGAGHGENLWVARNLGADEVVGVDYSSGRFLTKREENPSKIGTGIEFIEADLELWVPPPSAFDLVVSNNSFEHFQDPASILNKCHGALKPGGLLAVWFGPLFYSPWGAHRYGFSRVPYIQSLFSDLVAYEFFYHHLAINEEINRYTGEKILNGDPYPEVNKWKFAQFKELFGSSDRWEQRHFRYDFNFSFLWFEKIFSSEMSHLTSDDLFISSIFAILMKKE
jgi:SAM-dependent methyltransferase